MSAESPSPKNLAQPEPLRDGEIVRAAIKRRIDLHAALPADPKFAEKYPSIWSWATFQDVSEEKVKERAAFNFRVSEGLWVMSVSDPTMAASMSIQASTFEDCLKGLDRLLSRPDAPWVPWRGKEAKLKTRSKPK
jgi:hypothetical protein